MPATSNPQVVIDCFRCTNPQLLIIGQEPRQTTSNLGHLQKPSLTAIIHGLNRQYYSLNISCARLPSSVVLDERCHSIRSFELRRWPSVISLNMIGRWSTIRYIV